MPTNSNLTRRSTKPRGVSHQKALDKVASKGKQRFRMSVAHFVPETDGQDPPVCHVVDNPDGTRTIVCT